jgi:hypothetical protein
LLMFIKIDLARFFLFFKLYNVQFQDQPLPSQHPLVASPISRSRKVARISNDFPFTSGRIPRRGQFFRFGSYYYSALRVMLP